jgi:hypothetical protein
MDQKPKVQHPQTIHEIRGRAHLRQNWASQSPARSVKPLNHHRNKKPPEGGFLSSSLKTVLA